ncbi:50S ribosomal protein L32e [Candidatus Woesearchaeota archaeon]|nr:50S ribosomal protein L32e [Candidatus Woesearchaeota archaeon]
MTGIKEMLDVRSEMKERKPAFIRQDYHRRKRIGRKLRWKKPRGIHSKIRHHFKGRRKMPSPGYKSPSKVSGLHATGLKAVHVHSANDVSKIKKENEGIIISKQVGTKKKLEILRKAKELGIKVLNFNIDERIRKIEDFIGSKKKAQKESKKEAKEKPQLKKDLPEPEPKLRAKEMTDEEKKETEKIEKDKLLTKKV